MVRYMVDADLKGKHVNSTGFGDPHLMSTQSMQNDRQGVLDYIVRLLLEYSTRDTILLPYNTG